MFVDIEFEEEEAIEAEELFEVLHQINRLRYQYNKPRADGNPSWECELRSIFSTRIEAAFILSRYALYNCETLVDMPSPISPIREQLDIDAGFGPHREMLIIQSNHGMREVITVDGRQEVTKTSEITIEDEQEELPAQQVAQKKSGIVIRENTGSSQNRARVVAGKGKEKLHFVGSGSGFFFLFFDNSGSGF
ncbi:hypothetical protein ACET3Z_002121 [Daucus carota]